MHWLDPNYLPETQGTLERFVLNPEGDVDGMLLTDGTEIHTPPHLSRQLVEALSPGSKLSVRGVKPRDGDVIVAIAISPADGESIVDQGPDEAHHKAHHKKHHKKRQEKPVIHCGMIARLLHGPKGDVHGVLLTDETVVRFPPHVGQAHDALLLPKGELWVRGHLVANEQGKSIVAHALASDPDALEAAQDEDELA
ncbi:hypothetical protein ISP15_10010 [Dyella jejuensis]|uniref:Uncharacterized protein n=1 Tax=Dyella jejuensis TaxID=1432009 RepID=A0ABW8JK91_9GAMM